MLPALPLFLPPSIIGFSSLYPFFFGNIPILWFNTKTAEYFGWVSEGCASANNNRCCRGSKAAKQPKVKARAARMCWADGLNSNCKSHFCARVCARVCVQIKQMRYDVVIKWLKDNCQLAGDPCSLY